jgi:hypothetical protein
MAPRGSLAGVCCAGAGRPDSLAAGTDTRLVRRDLHGGPEQEVCCVNARGIAKIAVSPDGAKVALTALLARRTASSALS